MTSSYSSEVSVTASPGTSVLRVEATDVDEGIHGEVRNNIIEGCGHIITMCRYVMFFKIHWMVDLE